MKNETIKKWLRENGFRYASGQWRMMINSSSGLSADEQEMNRLGGRGFGRRSADAVVNSWHRDTRQETTDFLKKMGIIGFYPGVEYLPVFIGAPSFPIHDYFIESAINAVRWRDSWNNEGRNRVSIDRL